MKLILVKQVAYNSIRKAARSTGEGNMDKNDAAKKVLWILLAEREIKVTDVSTQC